ncbi:MAG TPA: PQQ-binding-like beta-propeller repeat protein [Gemmataceae bacterium]|nr:PQQ-binding-like beta-propeller repeat protein [Gemmataceae bacterium]
MNTNPALKRWLAAAVTIGILGAAMVFVARPGAETPPPPAQPAKTTSQDWIMYGGSPARNMVNLTAKGLPAKWDIEAKENIKWSSDLGSKAYGGPVIAGGLVLIGTNNQNPRDPKWTKPKLDAKGKPEVVNGKTQTDPVDLGVVMCFDESNGKFKWQAVHEKLPGGQVIDWPREGICSSPYLEGDLFYYISNRCEVVCAKVATGAPVWKLDMIKELGVFPHNISDNSPLLVGDYLWVVTSNGVNEDHLNVPAPKAPSFIKVDKKNGKVLWQDNSPSVALLNPKNIANANFFKDLVNRGELIQHGQWANAAYGVVEGQPQVLFPGGDGWLYAFDPMGKLIWKFDCNPKDAKYALKTGERSDFIATPVIYKNRAYIGIGQDPEHKQGIGHLWCIDMTKKGDVSPLLVTDNTVFPPKTKENPNSAKVWHYGGVITDKNVQKKLRRNYYFGRTMSTCAIHEDILYCSDLDGVLHCLDAKSGKPNWEYNTRSEIWSSPYYADGKIYLGTDDKTVFVFKHGADPKNAKPIAENEMDGRVRATPVSANGVLYVMTENKLYAIEEKKK